MRNMRMMSKNEMNRTVGGVGIGSWVMKGLRKVFGKKGADTVADEALKTTGKMIPPAVGGGVGYGVAKVMEAREESGSGN